MRASLSSFPALFAGPAFAADVAKPGTAILSPAAMFMQADLVVKSVMLSLVLAAFAAWVILFAKKIELSRLGARLSSCLEAISNARLLSDMLADAAAKDRVSGAFIRAAADEIAVGAQDRAGVNERIALRFQRIDAAALREASHGLGVLASIGATAPFVGLFGTVWGIMNSFIGIAHTQTTNLAVVAPGIAEALLATAAGLVAAVPAVLFYNHLTRSLALYQQRVGDVAALVSVLAGREIEHTHTPRFAA